MPMIRPFLLFAVLCMLFGGQAPAQAQNQFAPRLIVNDLAITNFEVAQRARMLQLFQATGDLQEQAVVTLTEDRLRMGKAKSMGLKVTEEQLLAGMEEFAARANLTAEQFVAALGEAGVAPETFRDFVEAGLLWRDVVRQTYNGKVNISEADIDRALAGITTDVKVRVLLSEIIIAAPPGSEEAAMALARRLKVQIKSETDFARAARENSTSATAGRGGRLDWMLLSQVPPELVGVLTGLGTGNVSNPIKVDGAVGLYLLRDLQQAEDKSTPAVSVEYAQYLLPAGANASAEAAAVRAKVDTCDDLYTVAKNLPADRLLRETRNLSEVPGDIAQQLTQLDPNESTDFNRGGAHVFLMLCSRGPVLDTPPSRDSVRVQLTNQRLAALAEGLLEELRANAIIREP